MGADPQYPPVPVPGVEAAAAAPATYEQAPAAPAPAAPHKIVHVNDKDLQGIMLSPGTQVVVVQSAERDSPCQCTAGWILFGLGFLFPILWLVGVFLFLCTRNKHDKRAAIGCGVAIAVYALFLGLFIGLYVVPLVRLVTGLAYSAPRDNTWLNNFYANNPYANYTSGNGTFDTFPFSNNTFGNGTYTNFVNGTM